MRWGGGLPKIPKKNKQRRTVLSMSPISPREGLNSLVVPRPKSQAVQTSIRMFCFRRYTTKQKRADDEREIEGERNETVRESK